MYQNKVGLAILIPDKTDIKKVILEMKWSPHDNISLIYQDDLKI